MSAQYIAQVTFQDVSNLSKDRFENSWHFSGDGTDNFTDATQIIGRLSNFYTGVPAGGNPITEYMARAMSRDVTVKIYLESDAKPRPVVAEGTFTIPASSASTDLPESVSTVMSYYSVRNLPRTRGRIFLGPLSVNALEMDVNPRPAALFLDTIKKAGIRLLANGDGAVALGPVAHIAFHASDLVYGNAPTISFPIAASVNNTVNVMWAQRSSLGAGTYTTKNPSGTKLVSYGLVTAGFISNGWHQQRRREVESSARVLFP